MAKEVLLSGGSRVFFVRYLGDWQGPEGIVLVMISEDVSCRPVFSASDGGWIRHLQQPGYLIRGDFGDGMLNSSRISLGSRVRAGDTAGPAPRARKFQVTGNFTLRTPVTSLGLLPALGSG